MSPIIKVKREESSAEVSCVARAQHGCDASRSWTTAPPLADQVFLYVLTEQGVWRDAEARAEPRVRGGWTLPSCGNHVPTSQLRPGQECSPPRPRARTPSTPVCASGTRNPQPDFALYTTIAASLSTRNIAMRIGDATSPAMYGADRNAKPRSPAVPTAP